jgi:hypothetical protein
MVPPAHLNGLLHLARYDCGMDRGCVVLQIPRCQELSKRDAMVVVLRTSRADNGENVVHSRVY